MLICVLEDESTLCDLIAKYLIKEGYEVSQYTCGEAARAGLKLNADMWIIDIMLPDMTGYSFLKEVKEANPSAYTIFISARNQDIDRVVGLELGCDDYIPKPFMMRELVLRVNRFFKQENAPSRTINLSPYLLQPDYHQVMEGQTVIPLTLREYDLLYYLALNRGHILNRETLIQKVWGDDYYGTDRVVDDTIRRLRRKLPELEIETVYGFGYCIQEERL
ncbi:MAG: response regulator transcription factor [Clostridiales bacterium]|nr:response regulator transcription factor [Clostridiales bacterium]MDD7431850.1 response regulator transcription factor [Clostridiales bacterium]MDY3062056.1 response regulator transcription factor [Eubacteriales bacterium]